MVHFLFAVFHAFIPVACGDKFTSPVSPAAWTINETQVVSWDSDLRELTVYLWQRWPGRDGADKIAAVYSNYGAESRVSEFDWLVTIYDADLDYSDVFFFWINPDKKGSIVSNYFKIVRPDDTATSATATATATNTGTSPASATSDPDSSTSTALTSTDKIALGIGIGIGVPVLAALCVLIWFKARTPTAKDEGTLSQMYAGSMYPPPAELQQPPAAPKEVPAGPPYSYPELPCQEVQDQQGQQRNQGQ